LLETFDLPCLSDYETTSFENLQFSGKQLWRTCTFVYTSASKMMNYEKLLYLYCVNTVYARVEGEVKDKSILI
jgi:hypothetical protein